MKENICMELAAMTDEQALSCLNVLLKGMAISNDDYQKLFNSPEIMKDSINDAFFHGEPQVEEIADTAHRNKVIREILIQMAESPEISPRLEAAMKETRDKLIAPIIAAVVLSGIIMVLSTHIKIDYVNENGKKKLAVSIEKNPTSESIIGKIFSFFH